MTETRKRFLLAGGALAILLVTVCWWLQRPAEQAAAAPVPQVPVAQVRLATLAPTATFTGYLEPVEAVDLMPRVSGQLVAVAVPEGQNVRQGQILFRIDPAPFSARLAQARAALDRAQAAAENARRDATRAATLAPSNAIPQRELEDAEAASATSAADVRAAEAAVRQAALELDYTNVRAPISGRVDRILVTRGNLVSAGDAGTATKLTRIVRTEPLHLYFDIDEVTYAGLAAQPDGATVDVALASDGSVRATARLDFVSPEVDRTSGTVRARAIVRSGDPRFKPGAFARATVATAAARPTVLVPEIAVGTDQDKRFVLALNAQNTTEYRLVTIGQVVDGFRVITSGLRAGERIVVQGLVRPGMQVRPQPWRTPQAEGAQR